MMKTPIHFGRATALWGGIFVVAFANGALREVVIKRFIEEPWAHHLSALTAVALFSWVVWKAWGFTRIQSKREAGVIGLYWVVLTVGAETVMGLMMGQSWEQILQHYDLFKGNLWPLVVVWVGVLPVAVFSRRGAIKTKGEGHALHDGAVL